MQGGTVGRHIHQNWAADDRPREFRRWACPQIFHKAGYQMHEKIAPAQR